MVALIALLVVVAQCSACRIAARTVVCSKSMLFLSGLSAFMFCAVFNN